MLIWVKLGRKYSLITCITQCSNSLGNFQIKRKFFFSYWPSVVQKKGCLIAVTGSFFECKVNKRHSLTSYTKIWRSALKVKGKLAISLILSAGGCSNFPVAAELMRSFLSLLWRHCTPMNATCVIKSAWWLFLLPSLLSFFLTSSRMRRSRRPVFVAWLILGLANVITVLINPCTAPYTLIGIVLL